MKKKESIIHFCDIQSDTIKELSIGNQRLKTCMGSDGAIYTAYQNIYKTTIYSFEITKDIHKVSISNIVSTDSLRSKRPQFKVAGFYVKDIPQLPTDLTEAQEKLRHILVKSGYPANKIESEIAAAQTDLRDYVDEFIGSNNSYSNSGLYYKQLDDNKSSYELLVPHELFERNAASKVYLYVASYENNHPKVHAHYYPKNKPYFYEEPVAEAIIEENSLLGSRILLGEAYLNGKKLNGFFIWANPLTKVLAKGKDTASFKAYFCAVPKVCDLKKTEEAFKKRLTKAPSEARKLTKSVVEKKLLEYVSKTLRLAIYEYNQEITVYPKDTSTFYSFIWHTNSIVDKRYVESDATKGAAHHEFKNLYDNFGFDGIYNSYSSLSIIPPVNAAKKIARELLQQPKGKRSISLDGFLTQLMGAAIYEAESKNNTMLSDYDSDEGNIIPNQINKDHRLFRDYLYSMIYSDSSTEYSGEGFFFYDSPIHYNKPKYDLGSEISPDLAAALINADEKDPAKHAFVDKVLEYWKKVKRYHTLLSDQLNIGDPDNSKDKRPTSGCHAIKKLLQEIFKVIDSYKIDIDYVYSDLEQITNAAWPLRTKHRIEQNNDYLYDLDLYKVDGKISYEKMWNAAFSSTRFKKEILPKLEARGYFINSSTSKPWAAVKASFWRINGNERPAMGYWLNSTYAGRRKINIWDCVMEEYYIELLEKYLFEPVKKYNPKAKYSAYHVNGSKGYNTYGKNIRFEPYLGGNINIGKQMSSCTALYGGNLSTGHCKYNLDDYRCFVEDSSTFAKFKNEVNTMRSLAASTPAGVMPFYSCKFFRDGDADGLYKESLFHAWLSNPDQMIAYLYYEKERYDKIFNDENEDDRKSSYFRTCYQDIQEVLNELNKYVTKPISKVITTNIVNETEDFVLSGVQTGDKNIWRLTPKYPFPEKDGLVQTLDLKPELNFNIKGKKISFVGKRSDMYRVYTNDNHGAWIVTPKTTFPKITVGDNYFESHSSYETDKPQKANNLLFTYMGDDTSLQQRQQNFWHMQGVSVFGEYAPKQIWEAHVRFNKLNDITIFRTTATNFEGIKTGIWYTVKAVVTQPSINDLENGKIFHGEIKYFCKIDTEKNFREVFVKSLKAPLDDSIYKPIQYTQIGEKDSVDVDHFKISIAGKNIRADLYRESDGVNITRVNKSLSYYKETALADTRIKDTIMAKISWLNASNDDESYTIKISQYDQNEKIIRRTTLDKINVGSGDQDYKLIPLPALNSRTRLLNIVILDKNNESIFENKTPIKQ